ncbi:uncharacterized protein LOC133038189 [Cannabis sativa]|uniref:uncharacterized protein LOC133038189 n=1 Tax=Cannabis sativa TaxID=3483 RepID=UPI0029CA9DC3|nr:uncharacterized protein LOC133038189 [Cannabis sativa]
MNGFCNALAKCGLPDMGYEGARFTWCNKHTNGSFLQERLDRMKIKGVSGVHGMVFKRTREAIRKKKKELQVLESNLNDSNWLYCKKLEKELDVLLYKDEKYWFSHAKNSWLKLGDKNSAFFHQSATHRKKKNVIGGIFDKNNVWVESPPKSPGKDGMNAGFYQNIWDIVGTDVCKAYLGFIDGSAFASSINETIITLIPKVKSPNLTSEFRPISLCKVLYKITVKRITNRLREVLRGVISEEQSAFISGRLITDNAMIGFECLNAIKRHKRGRKEFLTYKVDMAKAYDKVDWSFLCSMLIKLGFHLLGFVP